jgi:hypothetical protein
MASPVTGMVYSSVEMSIGTHKFVMIFRNVGDDNGIPEHKLVGMEQV